MRPCIFDLVVGIAAITCMLSFVAYFTGAGNAPVLIYMWMLIVIIPRLWHRKVLIRYTKVPD